MAATAKIERNQPNASFSNVHKKDVNKKGFFKEWFDFV